MNWSMYGMLLPFYIFTYIREYIIKSHLVFKNILFLFSYRCTKKLSFIYIDIFSCIFGKIIKYIPLTIFFIVFCFLFRCLWWSRCTYAKHVSIVMWKQLSSFWVVTCLHIFCCISHSSWVNYKTHLNSHTVLVFFCFWTYVILLKKKVTVIKVFFCWDGLWIKNWWGWIWTKGDKESVHFILDFIRYIVEKSLTASPCLRKEKEKKKKGERKCKLSKKASWKKWWIWMNKVLFF